MNIKIVRQLDKLGRLVIPADLRKQYGLNPGGKVYFAAYDDGILIYAENYVHNDDKKL